jgi:hypothetical protein
LDATTDPEVIEHWWSRMPDANIAISTGKESNLVVPDIDGSEGEALFADLQRQYGSLPSTTTVVTNRGRHLWLRYPKNVAKIQSVAREKLKLDVRGDGGYVLVPPSIHESGHVYAFASIEPLAECPAWLIEYANSNLNTALIQLPTSRSTVVANRNGRPRLLDAATIVTPPPPHTAVEEARLRSALLSIPARDRDIWLFVGMGLHWIGWGQPAFQIWDDWSRTAPEKYDEADQRKTWKSFDRPYRGAKRTVATIYAMAKERGWIDG